MGVRLLLSWIVAMVVGSAVVVIGPFEYLCGATIAITGGITEEGRELCRQTLLDRVWTGWHSSGNGLAVSVDSSDHWYVESPNSDQLRLCLTTADPRRGVQRLRTIAEDYLQEMRSQIAWRRRTPSEGEVVLSQSAKALEHRLRDEQDRFGTAVASVASLPGGKTTNKRKELLDQWDTLRQRFSSIQTEWENNETGLARRRRKPEPTHGIVPREEREEALLANRTVQQDLRELRVNLSELKLALLNGWQNSVPALAALSRFADQLVQASSSTDKPDKKPKHKMAKPDEGTKDQMATLADHATRYRETTTQFDQTWNQEFTALKQLPVDPRTAEVIEAHQRLRTLLNQFLFDGGQQLGAIRATIRDMGETMPDQALFHVRRSTLIRLFQKTQSAHHRFEFAASAIDPRQNFRLDAALHSARGLRRRSQEQIRRIEDRLEVEALRRAKRQRAKDLTAAEHHTETLRVQVDQTARELIALQEKLNLSADLAESWLRKELHAEYADRKAADARSDLTRIRINLEERKTKRLAILGDAQLTMVECGVLEGPINLRRRLRLGAVAALLTLLTVGLGQWWLARRT